ncbi:hypothetical protein [Paenibacillus hubeiensis]|uniref:hypothetical protein n=1 Tax=Paenibacillus hubeiensis TaxID=3077330 RepID=UPI0031BB0C4E
MHVKTYEDWIGQWLDAHFDTPHREMVMSYPAKTDAEDYGVPQAMQDGKVDEEGWVRWKMVASTVTAEQVREMERTCRLAAPVPPLYLAYLTTRFVLNVNLRYDDFIVTLPDLPSDHALRDVRTMWMNWEQLIQHGYIPIATYEDGAGPVCCDTQSPLPDGDYDIVWFDHEEFVTEDAGSRARLEAMVKPLFPSFRDMLLSAKGSPASLK